MPKIPFAETIATGILVIAKRGNAYYVYQTNKHDIPTGNVIEYLKEIHLYKYFRRSRKCKEDRVCSVNLNMSGVEYNIVLNTKHSKTYIYFNVIPDTKLTELLCSYNKNIKHELESILNQVSLIHDVVTIPRSSGSVLEYTNRINKATVDMISLLNDYNDYYTIKTHPERISLNVTNVSIKSLLDYAIGIIKTKSGDRCNFKIRVHKDITYVSVDKNKLLQLILCVINNSGNTELNIIILLNVTRCVTMSYSHTLMCVVKSH